MKYVPLLSTQRTRTVIKKQRVGIIYTPALPDRVNTVLKRIKFNEKEQIAVFPQALAEAVRHIEITESFDCVVSMNIAQLPEKFAIDCDRCIFIHTPHDVLHFFSRYEREFQLRDKDVQHINLYKEVGECE